MFDATQFSREKFAPRTAVVRVDALSHWFDGEPVWTVRGMTGAELARCNDAVAKNRQLSTLAEVLETSTGSTLGEVKNAIGLGDRVPDEIAKRLENITIGSVSPTVSLPVAVKLAEHFPVEFYLLTNKILELTGLGAQAEKKPTGSGPTPE